MKPPISWTVAQIFSESHGILATVHPTRGADQVPVVYAAADEHVGVPIDRVKPKSGGRLRRERNLEADPRASLLIEHWDRDDWSRLWWVRAELLWEPAPAAELVDKLAGLLETGFAQYAGRPFDSILVLRIVGTSGWSAQPRDQ